MRLFFSFIIMTVLIVLSPTLTEARPFIDVNHQTEMGRAIDFLSNEGVISGYEDGTFKPYNNVTRGQAAKMMAHLTYTVSEVEYNPSTTATFRDIPLTHQYYNPIQALVEYDVISGYADGTFKQGQPITRVHTAKMLAHLFVLPHFEARHVFSDVAKTSERYEYVNAVVQARIIRETAAARFSPNVNVTRGEFALFLFRAYNYTNTTLQASKKLPAFISTNSTIGKAFANHAFMKADIRQKMPIAAARQAVESIHFSSPATIKDNCSQFMNESFKLCYGQGFVDGQTGITSVFLYDDGTSGYKVNALQQALGQQAFTYESEKVGNVQWHYGKTAKAHNGLYYQFIASAGEKAPYATLANANIVQLQISTRPIMSIY